MSINVRYALDRETLQQFRHRVAVDLDQPHVGFELGCGLLEDRRHRPARTAPACPEINQQRNVAALDAFVEPSGAVQTDTAFQDDAPFETSP